MPGFANARAAIGIVLFLASGCSAPYVEAPVASVLAGAPGFVTSTPQAFAVQLASPAPRTVPVGIEVSFDIVSERPGFASAYAFSPNGVVTVLAENRRIASRTVLSLPPPDGRRFVTGLPAGREHIIAIVSRDPLPGAGVVDPPAAVPGMGHARFVGFLEDRLAALPAGTWAASHLALDVALP